MSIYYINKFKSVFLKSGNTKKTVSRLHWISLPTAMDAKGLKRLKKEYGWDCVGCFDEICKLAASCAVWGALVDDEGQPLDETDIAVKIDADIDLVKRTLAACMHPKINWIKKADSIDGLCINSVSFPPKSPLKPLELNGDSSEQTKDSLEQNATLSEQNGDSLGTHDMTRHDITKSVSHRGDGDEVEKSPEDVGRMKKQLRLIGVRQDRHIDRAIGVDGITPDAVYWCIQEARHRVEEKGKGSKAIPGLALKIIQDGDWWGITSMPKAPPTSWGEKAAFKPRKSLERAPTTDEWKTGMASLKEALGGNKPAKEAVA